MEVHQTHDKFFRSWFSRKENLANFLETALPTEVYVLLDTSTLAVNDGTFIDEEHREHFSDLSASVLLNGTNAKIYILVEHKSYSDRWALLQILRYMIQTWSSDTKETPSSPLVPILPVLFYHGETKVIPERFSRLFPADYPEVLKVYQPEFLCQVFNLTTTPDSSLRGPPEMEAALWALKYSRTQIDMALRAFNRLAETMGRIFVDQPAFKEIELYLLSSSGLTAEELLDKINYLLTNTYLKEDFMSTAENLIAHGEARGEARGVAIGEARGEARGEAIGKHLEKLAIARNLKNLGLSVQQICQGTGLTEEEVNQL